MYFAKFYYRARLFASYSLKDKRKIRRSILDKLERDFKLSAIEAEDQDLINSLIIACARVSLDRESNRRNFEKIRAFMEESYELEIYEAFYEEF